MKTAFWTAVIVYYAIILTKFYILPALRRREDRRLARMSDYERCAFEKYWKFCN